MTGTDTGGSAFEPSEGEQFELGIKYQPPRSNSLVTLSVFDLTQTNLAVTDPNRRRRPPVRQTTPVSVRPAKPVLEA